MRKLTTKEFIQKAKKVHGNKYAYFRVHYTNANIKVKITCPEHVIFNQTPKHHLEGHGCPSCSRNRKLTIKEFILKAKDIHSNKYDYSEVSYVNNQTKIKIICPEHGVFEQTPGNHLSGRGCSTCSGCERLTQEEFIKRAYSKHGDLYDYSKVEYTNAKTKVKITCPQHGSFNQTPSHHLEGGGCSKCGDESSAQKQASSTGEFVKKARCKHGDLYDYSRVDYKNAHVKVKIICPKHGIFEQIPAHHLEGAGCPKCCSSHGELNISRIFDVLQVVYKRQHRFPDCRNQQPLPFDFYLPTYNTCIEYDGEQHFKPVAFDGMTETQAETAFHKVEKHDKIKDEYCRANGIDLLRIPYTQYDNIQAIIVMAYNILNLGGILGVPCDYFHVSRLLSKQKGGG